MIDWVALGLHTCWIVGLSILLAKFSYERWLTTQGNSPPTALSQITISVVAYLLIGIGFVGTSQSLLERVIWLILVAILLITAYLKYTQLRSQQ